MNVGNFCQKKKKIFGVFWGDYSTFFRERFKKKIGEKCGLLPYPLCCSCWYTPICKKP